MQSRLASSKPFQFLIGDKEREFTIHSALVSEHSAALDKLINNDKFKEANDGYAKLPEVDVETFVCFIQYLYTGDYYRGAPEATHDLRSNTGQDGDDFDPPQRKKTRLREKFEKAVRNLKAPRPSRLRSLGTDCTGMFRGYTILRHARLFVFADCYDISGLAELALHYLGQELAEYRLYAPHLEWIVDLLRYCYNNSAPEDLKSLVVLWAACNVKVLWAEETFKDLLETSGEFSAALVGALVERLESLD
jgi:hypothetical protein